MARQHGVTASTMTRFIIDAGAVYANYTVGVGGTLLGATRGGSSFKIETDIREMEVDGARGLVKGGSRIVGVTASITANFLELSDALLLYMNPAATSSDYGPGTHDLMIRDADIATSDYITNIAIIGNSTHSATNYLMIILENALADGNFEVGMVDKEESVIPVTFTARFLPTDLETEPWKVYNPIIA